MKHSPTELHLFRDCEDFFRKKHNIFVEDYLGECIFGGDALNHCPINEIEFLFQQTTDKEYCARILAGITYNNPLITIQSESFSESLITFDIYYVNNYADVEDFYCFKTSQDFMIEGVSLFQCFDVKIKSLSMINDFWFTQDLDLLEW